jgi:2-keto-4-pentenoate hydratase/2-oxohepta-3-ene-1,7-dioic acid hydratase in catechol pathway
VVIHLARYDLEGRVRWGVVRDNHVIHLEGEYPSTASLIEQGESDWKRAATRPASLPLDKVELLSPVTTPCRVLCQGMNYRQHMIESGMDPDARAFNLFFDKSDASVNPPHAPVQRPSHVRLLDFEIELALVFRKPITAPVEVTRESLHEYVFGVTIANDLSARDVQLPQGQFFKGKSYRGFCPLGPFIAVPSVNEFDLIDRLDLCLEVNGVVRQQDSTANLIYKPAESISELSTFSDVAPGDVLLTGTPHGCVALSPPPIIRRIATAVLSEDRLWKMFIQRQLKRPYLQPGDRITARIKSPDGTVDLGEQRTAVLG